MPNAFASQPRKAQILANIEYTVKVIHKDGTKFDAPVEAASLGDLLSELNDKGMALLITRTD